MQDMTLLAYKARTTIPDYVDTLVIGAGLSGLYSAWQTVRHNPVSTVLVLDKFKLGDNPSGSSLERKANTTSPEQASSQSTVNILDRLMSRYSSLLEGVEEPKSVFEARSSEKRNEINGCKVWAESYYLSVKERMIAPSSMLVTLFSNVIENNPNFAANEIEVGQDFWHKFSEQCEWQGKSVKYWTLWDLLGDMGYSNEAIAMLCHASGFNSAFISSVNAGIALQLFQEFPSESQFDTLNDGLKTFPLTLVQEIGKDKVVFGANVTHIHKKNEQGYYPVSYMLTTKENVTERQMVNAKNIILGLKYNDLLSMVS
ncbi:hypothetical protein CS022_10970 [Veronia nyctiphanis]|uniref:Uncharacterized protein n=1 Tax=Veronia nyctiphanis TaxID=1278244 RepID=A0A4Q0YVQ2_9GAMM|nr:FAD/NAD(P)-binding protein [Veronia nyctiphanis]RXJ73249.1 hypothetical protein CS022_10970 [Veronia nyctiphanis]